MSKKPILASGICIFLLAASPLPAHADPDVQREIDDLESRVDEQEKLIEDQQRMLNMQSEEISKQKDLITSLASPAGKKRSTNSASENHVPNALAVTPLLPQNSASSTTPSPSQQRADGTNSSNTPPTEPPQPNDSLRPQVQAIADEGGILSPPGMLTYENTLEYTDTTRNLFTFNGVELAQVVLVGAINANSVQHQIVEESGRLRLGITNRLEADIHVPYVYRNDALGNGQTPTGAITTSSIQGYDLGDIDGGVAYQLNDGKEGWPYLIGNLRYKANNADGPYDVPYNSSNIATRLPTGTGFQTAEASVTAIKVTDPAVLFANLGYVYDLPRNIDKTFNQTYVGRVNPGDAVNALLGMAFAINQDTSFSLGYKHSYVFATTQNSIDLVSGNAFNTSTGASQVGALTMGISYVLTPSTSLNFNVEAGVTNDAPDVHLIFRVPIQLGNIF